MQGPHITDMAGGLKLLLRLPDWDEERDNSYIGGVSGFVPLGIAGNLVI